MNTEEIISYLTELVVTYAPKLAMAIVALIVGLWVIKIITRLAGRVMEKRAWDVALKKFMLSLMSIFLKIALFISILSMVGVAMTSFIAILGAAGLAVGLALSGTLQNFAGGVMILLLRPFRIGDFITSQGYSGTVKEIGIFNTLINTPDNKRVILPNSPLATNAVVNFSAEPTRRLDMTFGISYTDDIDKARGILQRLVEEESRVLKEPAPVVAVSALADSSVNFVLKLWLNGADYFDVLYAFTEQVKKAFDKEGISIPFPQQDVHLHQQTQN